jgi:hypothetical protein
MIFYNANSEILKDGPQAMEWEQYEEIIIEEWSALLENDIDDENKYHSFFECHPCILPRPFDVFSNGANNDFPYAIISKPVLPSFTRKVPDFMWITCDSASIYAVLIEIETPGKPWSTKEGVQHHKLTQAIDQLKDWKSWFSDPANVTQFRDYYRIPDRLWRYHSFFQKYILIYGRRDDATKDESFAKKRAQLQGQDEHFMTFDRLRPNGLLSGLFTVRIESAGYKAISIPPTLKLYPWMVTDLKTIKNMENAIRNNKYLSYERIEFLINMISSI